MRMLVSSIVLFLIVESAATGAVFQIAIPVETRRGERMAYLWIPPQADQVRGVVMAGMTLMEREFAQDARIRAACAEQQLAIVFLKSGLGAVDVQQVLNDLADKSGYGELSVVPLMFVGHSAGGPQARKLATAMSDRCFGLVQYRGGSPIDDGAVPAGVPCLMMIGQFDEFGKIGRDANGVENWEKDRDKMAGYRAMGDGYLGNILVEPGAGHYAWSDRNAKFLALFIAKAAAARIPARWPIDTKQPPTLRAIDPATGWLTDMSIKPVGQHKPAKFNAYTGDGSKAAWHFDRELAEATVAYHASIDRSDQFIEWKDPYRVSAGARFFFTDVKWVGDGQTFEVQPAYSAIYPKQYSGRGSKWGDAGKPVGRSDAPIKIKRAGGPIVVAGERRFRVRFDELAPATESARVTFMAYSNGDQQYRYTERVGMIGKLSAGFETGKAQTIAFPPVAAMKADVGPVTLLAKSDADLPVSYHIAFGPAKVVDGRLVLSDLPRRARYPLTIRVVAYQFGRGVEPKVQPATPVVRDVVVNR